MICGITEVTFAQAKEGRELMKSLKNE